MHIFIFKNRRIRIMATKMWAGRFTKESDVLADDFNSSIGFDFRMYKNDIEG